MAKESNPQPPNIIAIITDHFRPDFIGEYTPHLRRLASRGTRFARAYCAAPLCQPARVSMITGMSPAQHGVCGNQSPPIDPALRDDTYMQRLKSAGYATALIGKHHFIDRFGIGMNVCDDDEELKRYGFDQVTQIVDDGENQHNDDAYTAYLAEIGKLQEFRETYRTGVDSGRHPFPEDQTADGYIGSRGVEFVESYSGDAPFYLHLGFIGPHPPFWFPGEPAVSSDEMESPIGIEDSLYARERRARYTEKIKLIDRYVGRLVAALERRNKLDETLIVFTSDHGDNLGDYGIWDKRFFYESSCGVPLILSGPGVPSQERRNGPRVSRALVSHLDLYPTILGAAGIETPPDRRRTGMDLIPMAESRPASMHREILCELATCVMIHTGNWKLVYDPEQGGARYLFSLHADPTEQHNLAGVAGYESVTAGLVERILSHRIRRTQFSHTKEEQRLQSVRVG